jgi:NAD(P)-dependent dehydrogenase (short-subunit alcohol dehydrogenase family)
VQHFNISNITTDQILRTFEVNVFASFYLVRAAAPLPPPGSSIIFTSSGMARRPHGAAVDYAATKAALASMAQTLGLQLAPQGIRVNAVAPVYVMIAEGSSSQSTGSVYGVNGGNLSF